MAKHTFDCNISGVDFKFAISDEDASRIQPENIREYTDVMKRLIDASSRVMQEDDMFGGADIESLASRYAFHPFAYQIENVKKMLNRYCGRGVFGDQVGLGKTIEALMTAHVMFESGSIRNALLVVGKKTISGWVKEILTKFPGIFKIVIPAKALEVGADEKEIGLKSIRNIAKTMPHAVEIISEPDTVSEAFSALIDKIGRDNKSPDGSFRLYIATEGMLQGSTQIFERMREADRSKRSIERPSPPSHGKAIPPFIRGLEQVSPDGRDSFSAYFSGENIELGGARKSFDEFVREDVIEQEYLSTVSLLLQELRRVRGRLGTGSLRVFEKNRREDNIKAFDARITVLSEAEAELRGRLREAEEVKSLFVGERVIDLLMIDEIHKLYSDSDTSGIVESMSSFLSKIEKKFCVLISATPVRSRLDDIFELVHMSNPKMFGASKESEAKDYFLEALCRIPAGKPERKGTSVYEFPLAAMVCDEQGRLSDEKIKVFLGLVNSFFTRKRIDDVSGDMRGIYGKAYGALTADEKRVIEALSPRIIDKRALSLLKRGMDTPLSDCIAAAGEEMKRWRATDGGRASSAFYDKDGVNTDRKRHFFSCIDATVIELITVIDELIFLRAQGGGLLDGELDGTNSLIKGSIVALYLKFKGAPVSRGLSTEAEIDLKIKEFLSSGELLVRVKRLLYSMVNWQRRKKYGVAFVPHEEAELEVSSSDGEWIAERGRNLFKSLYEAVDKEEKTVSGGRFISKYSFSTSADDDLFYSLLLDSVLAYESRDTAAKGRLKVRELLIKGIKEVSDRFIEKDFPKYGEILGEGGRSVCLLSDRRTADGAPSSESELKSGEVINRFALAISTDQAGINLQQYKSFVFFQLDGERGALLNPVDIEQWIGRIHRTGQVKNCRIFTVIDCHKRLTVEGGNERYGKQFLEWYYSDILADTDGLDLYGNRTPDVAFIEPIVCDCIRFVLKKNGARREDYTADSFAKLAYKCYCYDEQRGGSLMKDYFQKLIRDLCNYRGFGKSVVKMMKRDLSKKSFGKGAVLGRLKNGQAIFLIKGMDKYVKKH